MALGKSGSDTEFSAGSIALGSAFVLTAQGSFSAFSAGAISGLGNSALRAGQNLSIDAGQGRLILTPWQASQLSRSEFKLRLATGGLVL